MSEAPCNAVIFDEALIGFDLEIMIERGKGSAPVVVKLVLIEEVKVGVEDWDHGALGEGTEVKIFRIGGRLGRGPFPGGWRCGPCSRFAYTLRPQ